MPTPLFTPKFLHGVVARIVRLSQTNLFTHRYLVHCMERVHPYYDANSYSACQDRSLR